MALDISFTISAADTPTGVFTALKDFDLSIDMTGSNTVVMQRYLNGAWRDWVSYTADTETIITIASGMEIRFTATTYANPISIGVRGEVNLNETLGAESVSELKDAAGSDLLDANSDILLDAAA
ncbi:hypothetical protein [Henriciella pelagia]|uniref:hypothetical protein n=1 Tax=Henriciella pelagia TaxID=1977912 RepID=UPI003515A777